jgi:hypothetical protein
MKEEFKRFKDTQYTISNFGNIYNSNNELLKPFPNNRSYLCVDLFYDGIRERHRVHRLVAALFIDNPEGKPQVNHIDGNKQNNYVTNLEWVTGSENIKHAYDTGLLRPNRRLSEDDVITIRARMINGELDYILANEYNISSGTISSIRLGKIWKHIATYPLPLLSANPVKKLSPTDIPTIRQMFKDSKNDAEIGRHFNVARGTINQIRQGKTWINY